MSREQTRMKKKAKRKKGEKADKGDYPNLSNS